MIPSHEIKPKKTVEVLQLIKKGWEITLSNWKAILILEIPVFLIYICLITLANIYFPDTPDSPATVRFINIVSVNLLGYLLTFAGIIYSLKLADLKPYSFSDIQAKMYLFPNYIAASLLTVICMFLGFICFIIPGIIVGTRFTLFGYQMVDKEVGAIKAMEGSWDLVKGATWKVFCFLLAIALINIIGVLCLGIGLLLSIPTTFIASALLYRTLWNQTHVTLIAKDGTIAPFPPPS